MKNLFEEGPVKPLLSVALLTEHVEVNPAAKSAECVPVGKRSTLVLSP